MITLEHEFGQELEGEGSSTVLLGVLREPAAGSVTAPVWHRCHHCERSSGACEVPGAVGITSVHLTTHLPGNDCDCARVTAKETEEWRS